MLYIFPDIQENNFIYQKQLIQISQNFLKQWPKSSKLIPDIQNHYFGHPK